MGSELRELAFRGKKPLAQCSVILQLNCSTPQYMQHCVEYNGMCSDKRAKDVRSGAANTDISSGGLRTSQVLLIIETHHHREQLCSRAEGSLVVPDGSSFCTSAINYRQYNVIDQHRCISPQTPPISP